MTKLLFCAALLLAGCRHFSTEDVHWARDEALNVDDVEARFGAPNVTANTGATGTETWVDVGHHLLLWGIIPGVGIPFLVLDLCGVGSHEVVSVEVTFDPTDGHILGRRLTGVARGGRK